MKTLLWVNACMRGEGISRTDGLCRVFLDTGPGVIALCHMGRCVKGTEYKGTK